MLSIPDIIALVPTETRKWADKDIWTLAVFFDLDTTTAALRYLDTQAVTKVNGPANRSFFQIEAETDFFTVLPFIPFCTCSLAQSKPSHHTRICPHILAAHLAIHLDRYASVTWEGAEFLECLAGR